MEEASQKMWKPEAQDGYNEYLQKLLLILLIEVRLSEGPRYPSIVVIVTDWVVLQMRPQNPKQCTKNITSAEDAISKINVTTVHVICIYFIFFGTFMHRLGTKIDYIFNQEALWFIHKLKVMYSQVVTVILLNYRI